MIVPLHRREVLLMPISSRQEGAQHRRAAQFRVL